MNGDLNRISIILMELLIIMQFYVMINIKEVI